MTKLTTKRFTVPVVIALAIAAVSTGAQAAKVDPEITTTAVQNATNAPIEQVGDVAVDFGNRLANGAIKLTTKNVQALGTALANGITAKDQTPPENNWTNKADEIAEAAAIVAARLSTNTTNKFSKSKAPKVTLALLKGIFRDTRNVATLVAASSPNFFQDVAGSVMLTLVRAGGTDEKTDSKVLKTLLKNAKKFAGKENASIIQAGLNEGFQNTPIANAKYEDGNLGPIIDPMTDTRNG